MRERLSQAAQRVLDTEKEPPVGHWAMPSEEWIDFQLVTLLVELEEVSLGEFRAEMGLTGHRIGGRLGAMKRRGIVKKVRTAPTPTHREASDGFASGGVWALTTGARRKAGLIPV